MAAKCHVCCEYFVSYIAEGTHNIKNKAVLWTALYNLYHQDTNQFTSQTKRTACPRKRAYEPTGSTSFASKYMQKAYSVSS